MQDAQSIVAKMIRRYQQAVLDKDVGGLVALYHADVRIFDNWGGWSIDGIAAWQTMIEQWFSSLKPEEHVAVTVDDVRIIPGNEVMGVSLQIRYAANTEAQDDVRAMDNRLSWTLVRSGDTWSIAHEHTSIPIDMSSGKGLTQRT